MRGHDHRQTVVLSEGVEDLHQLSECPVSVDVLLPMGAHDEEPLPLEPEPREHVGRFDPRAVMREDLEHRAARLDDQVRREPLPQQVVTGD